MILLLILFAENGMIEKIPMWYAYFLLFTINFTGLYEGKKPPLRPERVAQPRTSFGCPRLFACRDCVSGGKMIEYW
jgi:hypothetical protein